MTVGRPITAGRSRDRCVSNVVSNPISDAARAPSPLYRARGQRRPSAASGLPIRNDFGTLSRVDRFQHGESQRIGSMRADCHVTDDTMGSLVAEVRKELAEFICPQSGHLGHAFPIDQYRTIRNSGGENGVSHLEYESTPENFAKSLLQAAAIMGVDKTTELLAAWKQGGPVRLRKSTVVNGVVV